MKQKLIVIVGPTASGKSALAVRLAKKFNGEIISADSRQIYRELAIGSGAVTKKEMAGVHHHLLGVASARRTFTAAQFVRLARRAINDIARRGKLPIITGGTAFWIDALVYGLSLPAVKPDYKLRRVLEKKSPAALLALLKKLDPRRAKTIEQKNPRRLIRAIEIARSLGKVPPLHRGILFPALWIGLHPPAKTWLPHMARRTEAIIRRGLIRETRKLLENGISKKRIRQFGFEYTAALDAIERRASKDELASRIKHDTARFAKRQMRWWKRNPDIIWVNDARSPERLVRTYFQKTT